jgi:NAD(P)-dependent dehydrogenase (short-subunit alcohol dehydrogenase family)
VITGASGMMGSAFVKRYRSRYRIVAIHWRHELACATQNQTFVDPLDPSRPLRENDDPVFAIRVNLSSEAAIQDACTQIVESFPRVDLLINAAAHRRWCSLLASSGLADAELVMRVNLLAPIRLAITFATNFWRSHVEENVRLRRNVINVSSTAGAYVFPDRGQSLYGISKAALNHATYHLANELWDIGIRVNAVAPDTLKSNTAIDRVLDQMVAFDESNETGRVVDFD